MTDALASGVQARQRLLNLRGTFPVDLTLCEQVGMAGDSPDRCLFAGTAYCTCEEDTDGTRAEHQRPLDR